MPVPYTNNPTRSRIGRCGGACTSVGGALEDPLTSYVKHFGRLIGDRRTSKTFGEIVKGIIGAGSLICQQIASQSAELSKGKKGSRRVFRLTTGAVDEALAGSGSGAVEAGPRRL